MCSERGYIVPTLVIFIAALMGGIGLALDFQRLVSARVLASQIADAAALSIIRQYWEQDDFAAASGNSSAAQLVVEGYMHSYELHDVMESIDISVSSNLEDNVAEVQVCISGNVSLIFLRSSGSDTSRVSVCGESKYLLNYMEIALVYDLSESMLYKAASSDTKSKAEALEDVTKIFFDSFHDRMWEERDSEGNPVLRVGMVFFAGAVSLATLDIESGDYRHHIESGNERWSWIDVDGRSSYNSSRFLPLTTGISRIDVYEDMGIGWNGCVEARPYPLDVQDTPPSNTNPETLWVPFLAPDEPDVNNIADEQYNQSGYSYGSFKSITCGNTIKNLFANSYLFDFKNPPTNFCPDYDDTIDPLTLEDHFVDLTKYDSHNMSQTKSAYAGMPTDQIDDNALSLGSPYKNCDIYPIVPLTNNKNYLKSLADGFHDNLSFGTVIPAGLAWGWRILSPGAPFSEGRSYDTPNIQKILILMSDGENFVRAQYGTQFPDDASFALSPYLYYGYALEDGRIGGFDATNENISYSRRYRAVSNDMGSRTRELCQNIRDAGIRIYTIGFGRSYDDYLLRRCVGYGNEDNFFTADNQLQLETVFAEISQRLNSHFFISR